MPVWQRQWARVTARLGDSDLKLIQRLAGTVFLIRVASALLAYGLQVLFARWMGGFEFGIYVYVWTWVLLIGQALGLVRVERTRIGGGPGPNRVPMTVATQMYVGERWEVVFTRDGLNVQAYTSAALRHETYHVEFPPDAFWVF